MSKYQRLEVLQFEALFDVLAKRGYEILAPVARDGAIDYEPVSAPQDLARGLVDQQSPGSYRLEQQGTAYFSHTVGPHSWKKFLLPPKQKLFSAKKVENQLKIEPVKPSEKKLAFLGVRACEIAALFVQDKVLANPRSTTLNHDSHYVSVRKNALIIAVQCTRSSQACFCVSMKTGPEATTGFDLALTEVANESEHFFLIQSGSELGQSIVNELPVTPATPEVETKGAIARRAAIEGQTRQLDKESVRQALSLQKESPFWDEIATRCLSCANCTMVCPTCFCTTVEDTSDLTGQNTDRWKKWDSCFNHDFTYVHGGSVRTSTKSKYRQWLTHKLSYWWDQFGESGCVGCGRCITWCPVGIDLTAEAKRFIEAAKDQKPKTPET